MNSTVLAGGKFRSDVPIDRTDTHVLQAAGWYLPYGVGGTEVYLADLIGALRRLGIVSSAIVPRSPDAPECYEHDGARIATYPVNSGAGREEVQSYRPHEGFDVFLEHLRAHPGAIYHQHSWTRGCGPLHLRAAREAGLRTVVTVHVPSNICLRGSMLKFGEAQCDGRIDASVCGACWAQARGMPDVFARSVGELPDIVSKAFQRWKLGRFSTALGARALATRKRDELREMVENADRVVAVCQWLYDALLANGAPPAKVVLSRQGISTEFLQRAGVAKNRPVLDSGPLRLLYLGRWDRDKGIDVVVRAVRALPRELSVRLSIRATANASDPRDEYETYVRGLAEGDERIALIPPVPRERIVDFIAENDVLLVPSVTMETGPLVVLEAQAVGLFVVGARMGGIAELVQDGDGGRLVAAGDVPAWSEAIGELARAHAGGRLRRRNHAVRTMDKAACEMAAVYQSISA